MDRRRQRPRFLLPRLGGEPKRSDDHHHRMKMWLSDLGDPGTVK